MGKDVKKAKTVASKVLKTITKRDHKVRTKTTFFKPNTKVQARKPRKLQTISTYIQRGDNENPHNILIKPFSSDKNMQKMENENTLTFHVPLWANKTQIKNAFKTLYQSNVRQVSTLIRPDGKKKAFVRLAVEKEALKIATKIGII
jgi:large subunit ribosomal protein L23Ae